MTCSSSPFFVVNMDNSLTRAFAIAFVTVLLAASVNALNGPGNPLARVATPDLYPSSRAAALAAAGVYHPSFNASLQKIGGCRRNITGAVFQATAPDNETITFFIELAIQNELALMTRINQMYTPLHPLYRQFMNSSEFSNHHEHSAAHKLAFRQHLEENGIHVLSVVGRLLHVTAPVHSINTFFHTTMAHYSNDERNFTACMYDLQVAPQLGIHSVLNLHTVPRRVTSFSTPFGPVGGQFPPPGNLTYHFLRQLYGVPNAVDGSGQTVAIIADGSVNITDIHEFEATQITGSNINVSVTNIQVNNYNPGTDYEATIDVSTIIAMAPRVTEVLVYMCYDLSLSCLALAAEQNLASSMSTSYGAGDVTGAMAAATNNVLLQFAAQGITFITAAGDCGCGAFSSCDWIPTPTDQPLQTSVGGTVLGNGWNTDNVAADAVITSTYPGESEWSYQGINSGSGGGGGLSFQFAMPEYQAYAVSTYGESSIGQRNYPDVAAVAVLRDPNFNIYYGGVAIGNIGGTSVAAPLWNGMVALFNQMLGAGRVGFLNPILYSIYADSDVYADAFHDINSGGFDDCSGFYNVPYPALFPDGNLDGGSGVYVFHSAVGYDLTTGLGTPNFPTLSLYVTSWTPAASGASGLVNWLPLQNNTRDYAGNTAVTVGGSTSCASFSGAGPVPNAWTQTCGSGSSPAYIELGSTAALNGDFTSCVAFYAYESSQAQTIMSCATGESNCLAIQITSGGGLAFSLQNFGPYDYTSQTFGSGTISYSSWTHVCVILNTYGSGYYSGYLNSNNIFTFQLTGHTSWRGETPVLGVGVSAAFTGSFVNWRLYDVVLSDAQIETIAAGDTPGPAGTYSSFPTNSVVPPPPPSNQDVYFPLQGDYIDRISGNSATILGSSSCGNFASSSGPWVQSCTSDSTYAVLSPPSFTEFGDFSVCFHANAASFAGTTNNADNTFFLSCSGFSSGNVDCVELYYYSPYSLLVVALNANAGHAISLSLSVGTWYHFCVVYSSSSATLLTYVNGNEMDSYTVSHTTSNYGAPIIPGYGDPISFLNWRLYNSAISAQQVASLYASDAPGSGSSGSSPGNGSTASNPPPSGLVHFFPLEGNYNDQVSGTVIVEGTASCAAFGSSGSVYNAWKQTCTTSPAYLQLADTSVESSDFTVCVAAYAPSWPQENSMLVYCEVSGSSDCGVIRYDSTYSVLVFQLSSGGGGAADTTLPTSTWFHVCVSYASASQTLSGYLNGNQVYGADIGARNTYTAASPVLGGGYSSNWPFVGSFVNWRLYNTALSASNIASIAASDTP